MLVAEQLKEKLDRVIAKREAFGFKKHDLSDRFTKIAKLLELHKNWVWQFETLHPLNDVLIVSLPPSTFMLIECKDDDIVGIAITAIDRGDDNTGIYVILACVALILMADSNSNVDIAGDIIKSLGFLKNMEKDKNHNEAAEHNGFLYRLHVSEAEGFWFGASKL